MIGQVEGKAGADRDVSVAEVSPALNDRATAPRDVSLERRDRPVMVLWRCAGVVGYAAAAA